MTSKDWLCFFAGSVAMAMAITIGIFAYDSVKAWRIRRNIIKKQRNTTHDHEYL